MVELQRRFLVCKVGLTGRTRGRYGYIWDLTERWLPEAVEEASQMGRGEAREEIWQPCQRLEVPLGYTGLARILGWEQPE